MTDSHDFNAFRILDAAINRASEGTRVVEDFTRMELNDAYLSSRLKQLRHDLNSATDSLDPKLRIAARDSQSDVGRDTKTETEYQRKNVGGIVQANMSRAAQALRTIEEFSKPIDASVAQVVEQIRYDCYTLEKAILTTMMSQQNLGQRRLYVLLHGMNGPEQLRETAKALVRAGVGLLQLRDKRLGQRELVIAGRTIGEVTSGSGARWIMNDRCDLALAAGADGVHLGQDDIRVSDARRIMGPSKLIGVSTHDIDQARHAVIEGANYIGVGPVFPSQTKSFDSFVGPDLVQKVMAEISLPAYAIGGITPDNLDQLLEVGCRNIAISSVVMQSDNPVQVVHDLGERLNDRSMRPGG